MDINLGEEQIVELQASQTPEEIHEKALSKRVDAFGQLAKFLQRPKPEDIEITTTQKRLEPFWFAAATARYVYDRRHTYRVDVAPEVQAVTIYGNDHAVTTEKIRSFALEAEEHCMEELRREIVIDPVSGNETDLTRYLKYPKRIVPDVATLEHDGTLVVLPEVRGSFVVRKLVSALMKTFQADRVSEERIDVEQIAVFYRPIYAVEYLWKAKQKTQVLEFDALTGEIKAEGGEIKKKVVRALENDALFDVGADAIGTILPGANIAVKLGRIAARKVVK
jgi:hypothetical protein